MHCENSNNNCIKLYIPMEVLMVKKEDLMALMQEAGKEAANIVLNERGLKDASRENPGSEQTLIRGINGLAKFLNVSIPTAMKMKKSKMFPCTQYGRTLFFKPDEVLDGLSKHKRK